jgi:DsbC/DsbD-like thiol-disulfide interchange protein
VPPRFDFSGSQNLKGAEVSWPAPIRFSDAGGTSIGYKGSVILPLRITPQDPTQPVRLKLALDYAVCEKLCVLAEARLSLDLEKQGAAYDAILAASERQAPRRAKVGEPAEPAIRAVRVERTNPPRVTVTLAVSSGVKADLFAEGPGGDWSLPLPEPIGDQAGSVRQFAFNLDGIPPGTSTAGAIITLTAVTDEGSIEVATPLD